MSLSRAPTLLGVGALFVVSAPLSAPAGGSAPKKFSPGPSNRASCRQRSCCQEGTRSERQVCRFASRRAGEKIFQCALGRLPAPSPHRAESGHRLCRRLYLSPLRRCGRSPPIKRPEQVKKAAVVPSLRPANTLCPEKGGRRDLPQPLPNGAFSRTCLHLVMAETLCCKKGAPRTDRPGSAWQKRRLHPSLSKNRPEAAPGKRGNKELPRLGAAK